MRHVALCCVLLPAVIAGAPADNLARDSAYSAFISGYVYRGQVIPGTNTPATTEGYMDAPPWQGLPFALVDGRRDGEAVVSWFWSAMSKRIRVVFDLRRECQLSAVRLWPPAEGDWTFDAASARLSVSRERLAQAEALALHPEEGGMVWTGDPMVARFVEITCVSSAPQIALAEVELQGTPIAKVAADAPPPGLIPVPARDLDALIALPEMPAGYANAAARSGTRVTVTSEHYDDQTGKLVADDCAARSDPTGRALVDGDRATTVSSFGGWYAAKRLTVEMDLGGGFDLDRVVVWSAGHGTSRSFINSFSLWVQAGEGAPWMPLGDTWNPLLPGEIPAATYPLVSPPVGRPATALRLQLNGVAQSADMMQVAEIEVWGKPAEKPIAPRPWRVREAVPDIARVAIGELSPALDWITRDRIRALYGYAGQWRDSQLLEQVVAAGFNTFIVHTMGASHSEEGWPEEAQRWAGVQRERNLRVIISWPFGSDERYGNAQFGAYQPGGPNLWTRTPCPLSREYWDRVIGERAAIAAQAGLTGLVVDMEMYGADSTRYAGPCYCDSCWRSFVVERLEGVMPEDVPLAVRPAWAAANGLAADYARWQELAVMDILRRIEQRVHAVAPGFLLGNLLDPESLPGLARGLGTPAMPALIFSELEYGGDVTTVPARVVRLREEGYPALYVTGLAVKSVTPQQLPEVVAQCAPVSAGYWLWSSAAFSPEATADYQHAPGYSHDDYWDAFNRANRHLTAALAGKQ